MKKPKHTGFQWAQIELLKAVSAEFIFRALITSWRSRIKHEKLFAGNVLTGFLNVHAMLTDNLNWERVIKKRLDDLFQKVSSREMLGQKLLAPDWQDFIFRKDVKMLMDDLLVHEGHLLFNSYFYSVENVYGHERFFFRKIWQDVDSLEAMLEGFDKEKLPFRIYRSEEFVGTYSNQLLPVSAGVTPLFLNRYQKNEGKSSFKVKYFLESLALLHKREDFVQGHYSAIVNIINGKLESDKKKKPIPEQNVFRGAFILTCILPDAFTETHETLLSEIIRGKLPEKKNEKQLTPYYVNKFEMLEDQYLPFKLDHKKFFPTHQHPIIEGLEGVSANIVANLNDIVKRNFDLLTSYSKNNHLYLELLYKCVVNGRPQVSKHHFINVEGIYHVAKMLFPTATTLDHNLVSGHNSNKNLVNKLDFKFLKGYNETLDHLFSKSRVTGSFFRKNSWLNADYNLLAQFIECLYPGRKSDPEFIAARIQVREISPESIHRLVIFQNNNVSPGFEDAVAQLKTVIQEATARKPSLPDGENPIFAKAEKDWIGFQERTGNFSAALRSDPFFKAIRRVVECGARSILLLRERPYYIPDIPKNEDPEFIARIENFPSFWVFERLCSYLAGAEHLYGFGDLKKSMNALYRYPYQSGKKITVCFSPDNQYDNDQLSSVLLFLGIHVHEIQPNAGQTYLKIDEQIFTLPELKMFYQEYLKFKIDRAKHKDNSLLPQFFEPYKIDDINWLINPDKSIHMDFNLDGQLHTVDWHPYNSFELDMTIIDIHDLSKAFSQKNTIGKKIEILPEQFSIRQVIAVSGEKEDSNYKAIKSSTTVLKEFGQFDELVNKITVEKNDSEAKILLELNEIFLHRIRRLNQYLDNSLQKDISKKINKVLFELGFIQLREVQNQLFALSRTSSKDRKLKFDKTEVYSLEALLYYFYLKNLLFIDYTSVYSYVFRSDLGAFSGQMLDPMMEKIKCIHDTYVQSPLKAFFKMISEDESGLRLLYEKIIAAGPEYEEDGEKRPPYLACQNDIGVLLPVDNFESFWNYLSAVFDEITDNSLNKAKKLKIELNGRTMLITSELADEEEPFSEFKDTYAGPAFVKGDAIRPILDPLLGRISYGTYGLKIACKELGWDFGIRYDETAKIVLYQITFPPSRPFIQKRKNSRE
jgi:hypothetical protein